MKLMLVIASLIGILLLRVYMAVEFIYYDRKKGLVFTFLGTRYCGPGTDVEEMDKIYGPLTEVDWACREHDLIYINAHSYSVEELWEHDRIFLERARLSGTHWYLTFCRIFLAKLIWETYIGPPYAQWHIPKPIPEPLKKQD